MNTTNQKQRWQNLPLTRQFLNSSLYRPYMWTKYTIDNLTLPFLSSLKNPRERQFHCYVIGTMKSGTTSLGRILKPYYNTAHEALPRQSCLTTALFLQGKIKREELAQYIQRRDNFLNLELESSWFLVDWLEILVSKFPDAKFILPIRDPYSWVASMVNQEAATNTGVQESYWKVLFNEYFKDNDAETEDTPLLAKGLHSVSAYLKHWNYHHQKVIETVPAEKLLILKTSELNYKIEEISNFLGIDHSKFETSKMHQNKTKNRLVNIDNIPKEHINKCVDRYCLELTQLYFPEFL
ncbi:sulfotransferase [Anabaena sp. UHCC 0451]|uniref:sulfotransferase n=1 Tax=Anabaena sp. UHCC 0451 TaxID=2055235 RepID=UPI002B1F746E|nr:sulfotransferase [Anabaena sp. UHCC 0451]MEA5575038.1 sulfotransferase [Anabaena sp. UHCC 0451]